jgi:stage III sporulation protein AD
MSIFILSAVCLIAAILVAVLRQYNSVFAVLTVCAVGVICIVSLISEFSSVFSEIISTVQSVGNFSEYIKILLKAICICIISDIVGGICKDTGNGSIAVCVDVGAKIVLLALSLPLINDLIEIIRELFNI